ncbi:hypothetical protein FISHEDRAFT_78541 [Fistulina hepatica ATCC 64428]|nr:hypothetical protein FISHEDRAFT_78541 [Fistulina hepatica ATCC 64428]
MASTAGIPAVLLSQVPIVQPAHLEGDPSLATEILPGPPSVASARQAALKRDPKKPAYSYLPEEDPGTSYSGVMHGTLIGHETFGGLGGLKSTRADGSTTGRAQRASARRQNGAALVSLQDYATELQVVVEPPAPVAAVPNATPALSRSNSSQNIAPERSQSIGARIRRRDKGKGKETANAVHVKEEPQPAALLVSPEPPALPAHKYRNEDHCSACRSQGALVYCDGCPRAFHLWCLDPPMESIDEGDSSWFCPACTMRKQPSRRIPPTLLAPLIHHVMTTIPREFQLPEDIRTFFKDVATGPKGDYVDGSQVKPQRLNRFGALEERDPFRLRDRNGAPVLCYACGMSALPESAASTSARRYSTRNSSIDGGKGIISCDYCNSHWHLDCLNPPLMVMPSLTKKWMCPHHADKLLPPRHRIPRHNAAPIDITKPNQYNNGNIEITHSDLAPVIRDVPKVDEVLINGRRYRVPERVVILDFWNKVSKNKGIEPNALDTSSPLSDLTSLSEDEDEDDVHSNGNQAEFDMAQALCDFQANGIANVNLRRGPRAPHRRVGPHHIDAASAERLMTSIFVPTMTVSGAPTNKRRRIDSQLPYVVDLPTPPAHDLRSNATTRMSSLDAVNFSNEQAANGDASHGASPSQTDGTSTIGASVTQVGVKAEPGEPSQPLTSGDGPTSFKFMPAATPSKRPRGRPRKNAPRGHGSKPSTTGSDDDHESKRTRKRKDKDDDNFVSRSAMQPKYSSREKRVTRSTHPVPAPAASTVVPATATTVPASAPVSVPASLGVVSAPATTPSLKIRLPRLSAISTPSNDKIAE